jgi:hypothetical protein
LLSAQRVSSLGTTIDVVGGFDKNPQVLGGSNQHANSYSIYPALSFGSQGAESHFSATYAFGWNRLAAQPPVDSNSHIASANLQKPLSSRSNMSLSSSFSSTSDVQTMFALRGIIPNEDESGLIALFQPVAVRQSAITFGTNVGFDHRLSDRSSLSFGGEYTRRDYKTSAIRSLSDQNGLSGNVSYSRRITERASWNLGYQGSYYRFTNFDAVVSNSVQFGISNQLAKETSFNSSFGISHVQNSGDSSYSASFEGSASLAQTIKRNIFDLSFSQNYGHPSGLGAVSRNRRASLGVSRELGRHVNVYASANVSDSKGILDNTVSSRGGGAAANVGFLLTQQLSLQVGAQLQRYTQPAPFAFTQKRLFASLRYTHPNLLRSR